MGRSKGRQESVAAAGTPRRLQARQVRVGMGPIGGTKQLRDGRRRSRRAECRAWDLAGSDMVKRTITTNLDRGPMTKDSYTHPAELNLARQ